MRHLPFLLPLLAWTAAACGDKPDSSVDADSDGFSVDEDCDDSDASINPDAAEACDGVDNNCDGAVDEGVTITVYADADGDGFGDAAASAEACAAGSGYVADSTDCDDSDAAFNPGATEDDCTDPSDYNCDGSVAYADADGDGWAACEDCNDSAEDIRPDADELCDGIDNDCDKAVDEEAIDALTWYADLDGDGYGDLGNTVAACEAPSSYIADSSDCDDAAETIYPGAEELCDAADSDCDGTIAEALVPTDYASISAAMAAGEPWICVEPGTYSELIDFGGEDFVIESSGGPDVTIIDGAGSGPVVTFAASETSAATLRGFTISGGYLGTGGQGAGVYINGADPTLASLIIEDNEIEDTTDDGDGEGAGLYAESASFTLTDSVLQYNTITGGAFGGGGATLAYSEAILDHVTFEGNAVIDNTPWGGGLMIAYSDVLMNNVAFYANEVDNYDGSQLTGAAISTAGGSADITNAIFAGNISTDSYGAGTEFGVAYFSYDSHEATLTNVTITGNTTDAATYAYGQVITAYLASITLVNVDITDNGATSSAVASYAGPLSCISSTAAVSYTNLYGTLGTSLGYFDCPSTSFTGMLARDPLYTDVSSKSAASWDLTLSKGSPLIDAGDPTLSDADRTTSDIGAYGGPGGADW